MDPGQVFVHGVETGLTLHDGGSVVGELELVERDEGLRLPELAARGRVPVEEGVDSSAT